MGLKSTLSPTSNVGGVEKFIDTAYDNVKIIADNMDALLALYANFDNANGIYLGKFTSHPIARSNNSPLMHGDHYLNTSDNLLYIFTAVGWLYHSIFYTQSALNNAVGVGPFNIWIAYADDALGNGISLSSTGKVWLGLANGKPTSIVDITDKTVFTWVKIKGNDGVIGLNGAAGANGLDGAAGAAGLDGATGIAGAAGVAGVAGTNSYIHIAYADSSNGSVNFNFLTGKYLGALTDTFSVASINSNDYIWNLIQGSAGTPGLITIDLPTIPTNTQAFVNDNTVRLTWDTPTYSGHWYTKIYRVVWDGSTLVPFAENLLAAEAGADFIDIGLLSNQNYLYWFRHVNLNSVESGLANSGAGLQVATLAALQDTFNWIDTAHLRASIKNRLDNIDSTIIDGESGLLGAHNVLKLSTDAVGAGHNALTTIVGDGTTGLVKAHNDLVSAYDSTANIVGDANNGLVNIASSHGTRITNVETTQSGNVIRLNVLEASTKPLIASWTGLYVLAQSETINSVGIFTTVLAANSDMQGVLRIEITLGDKGFHVAMNGVEITDVAGFNGASSSNTWYVFTVDIINGANTVLIWSDDLDQPTVTSIELRKSVGGSYSKIISLESLTSTHTTKLSSLGTFSNNSFSVINNLQNTDATHTSELASLGTFTNNKYSVITNLQATDADHAIKLSSLGSWDAINNKYSIISDTTTSVNGLNAQKIIKIDINGNIAGYGLASTTSSSNNVTSEFSVLANKFIIATPGTAGVNHPFYITGNNVYMSSAYILNLTAAKLTAGTIGANNILIGSSNFNISGGKYGVGLGTLTISNGTSDILELGYLNNNTVGLLIKDAAGAVVFKSSTDTASVIRNTSQQWSDISGIGRPADGATVGDPYGASFNLLDIDAGIVQTLPYFYFTKVAISSLSLKVGESISFSALISSTLTTANNFDVQLVFYNSGGISLGHYNGNSASGVQINFLSKLENIKIPVGTVSITAYATYTVGGGILTSDKAVLNRGPAIVPYIAPYSDGADVTLVNTAASITGQGTLATQNNIALATQVTGFLNAANADNVLINSNISINPSGTLSGAGGGAVNALALLNGPSQAGADKSGTLSLIGSANIVITGNTAKKTGGLVGWAESIHSKNSFTGGAFISFSATSTTTDIIVGLNVDPSLYSNFSSLEYSITLTSIGTFKIYESGISQGTYGTYAIGGVASIIYDGYSVKYYYDGALRHTSLSHPVNAKFYLTSSLYQIGSEIVSIQFDINSPSSWRVQNDKPIELTDGRVAAGLDSSGLIDLSRPHVGKSLANVDSTANTKLGLVYTGVGAFSTLIGQINVTNISTYMAGAAIGTAYIQNAAITNALIANAAVGNAKISDLVIDKLTSGSLGAVVTLTGNSRIVLDNGTFVKVQGIGFGSTSQFLEWFGPKVTEANMTEANAISYIKTNGAAYFAGALSAGTLYNSITGTNTVAPDSTILGPFGSNGGSIIITQGFTFVHMASRSGTPVPEVGSLSATIKLYRTVGTGAEILIATNNIIGSIATTAVISTFTQYKTVMTMSVTTTDNLASVSNRTYRLEVSNRTLYTWPGTTVISDNLTQTKTLTSSE